MADTNHSQLNFRTRVAILLVIAASTLPLSVCSRTPRIYRVGILVGSDRIYTLVAHFKSKLTELGYIEGKNIVYNVQRNSLLTEQKRIAAAFVADKVDLVFAFPGQAARAVKDATRGSDIPIVFANAVVEGTDLVDSIRSPGKNITGVRVPGTEMTLKRFEFLLEFTPRFKTIMVVYEENYPATLPAREALRSAAMASKVRLQEIKVSRLADVPAVLQELEKSGDTNMDAIMFLLDTIPQSAKAFAGIFKFADAHRVPVVGGPVPFVTNGQAVFCVTTASEENGQLAAVHVDKIFKGTPAGSIPVASLETLLYINYAKARELGLTVPRGLLKQAREIVR